MVRRLSMERHGPGGRLNSMLPAGESRFKVARVTGHGDFLDFPLWRDGHCARVYA